MVTHGFVDVSLIELFRPRLLPVSLQFPISHFLPPQPSTQHDHSRWRSLMSLLLGLLPSPQTYDGEGWS